MDAYIIYQSHIAIVMNAIGKTGTSQISLKEKNNELYFHLTK